MIPTSIDGTDITGATIDGTDVQEITVDGQTVFSAGPSLQDIVAPGNLIAWYPFTNQADDETRTGGILDNDGITVGDATDYSPNTIQPTYQTSGGVTDLQTGPNSAYYDFTPTEKIITPNINIGSTDVATLTAWTNPTSYDVDYLALGDANSDMVTLSLENKSGNLTLTAIEKINNSFDFVQKITNKPVGSLNFVGMCYNSNSNEIVLYLDGNKIHTGTFNGNLSQINNPQLHMGASILGNSPLDGLLDDVRVYNKELSQSECDSIFQNTKP